ncbi:MAG TPA: hypothetical protein VFB43_18040 [Terracidiphilus sp.]|nr:hypothetical protein [Terracidiphilus sp.]
MKRLILLAATLVLSVGCQAQLPPTTWQVAVTWQAPQANTNWAGCTAQNPCTYAVSRIAVASGTICPTPSGGNYALAGNSASQALNFLDTAVTPGTSYCYLVQTQQVIPPATQPATSSPSNTAFIAVPANPGPPTAPSLTPSTQSTQTGSVEKPMPEPTSAVAGKPSSAPVGLVAVVVKQKR